MTDLFCFLEEIRSHPRVAKRDLSVLQVQHFASFWNVSTIHLQIFGEDLPLLDADWVLWHDLWERALHLACLPRAACVWARSPARGSGSPHAACSKLDLFAVQGRIPHSVDNMSVTACQNSEVYSDSLAV